jgi:hypothetical protein
MIQNVREIYRCQNSEYDFKQRIGIAFGTYERGLIDNDDFIAHLTSMIEEPRPSIIEFQSPAR